LTASDLAETFDKDVADITLGITLVLLLRSVGSIIFGIAADRYGRKWPFIVNNLLFIVLELVSVVLQTTTTFFLFFIPAVITILEYGSAQAFGQATPPVTSSMSRHLAILGAVLAKASHSPCNHAPTPIATLAAPSSH
jgi:MFS family permease